MLGIKIGNYLVRCDSCKHLELEKFKKIGPCFDHNATVQVRRLNEQGRADIRQPRYCLQNVLDNWMIAPFASSEIQEMKKERVKILQSIEDPIIRH